MMKDISADLDFREQIDIYLISVAAAGYGKPGKFGPEIIFGRFGPFKNGKSRRIGVVRCQGRDRRAFGAEHA